MQPSSFRAPKSLSACLHPAARLVLCALAVVAAFWLYPSKARAGCGYYITVGNPSVEYQQNLALQHASMRSDGTPLDPASRPCNGPQCRSNNPATPTPAPAPTVLDRDLLLCLISDSITAQPGKTSNVQNWFIRSEAHHLIPDPPPRSLSSHI